MHHQLYSVQDSYFSNKSTEKDKNFGLDEMLIIGVTHSYSNVIHDTRTYHFANEFVAGMKLDNYSGLLTGSFFGVIYGSNGTIVGSGTKFTASYFSGSLSGSILGTETGSAITSSNYVGNLYGFAGNISSSMISGWVSSSLTADCFSAFTGVLTSSIGYATGYLYGNEIKAETYYTLTDAQSIDRTLVKFDLTFISQSIVSGDITNPKYYLKLKSTQARDLPVTFKIYAFPVSQSWNQGDGYWSDSGGSDFGVSWRWRTSNSSSAWFSTYTTTTISSSVDYLNDYSLVTESFKRGGGTWYNFPCTQSFNYEVSDINMDVTTIVNAWLSGTPNEGFILMYSGETNLTSSNASMYFFSHETNTIYSPKLDVAWDDSSIITGSFSTGSVIITNYLPRISGSVASGTSITGSNLSGSFSGNAYIVYDSNGIIQTNSIVDVTGNTDVISGVNIVGNITGSSFTGSDGNLYVTASIINGDYTGSVLYGQYSSSMITGWLTSSFIGDIFVGYGITGSIGDNILLTAHIFENSPYFGHSMGSVLSGNFNSGIFQGVITDGILKGSTITVPFTGSYSYITASYTFTSSVEITGSLMSAVDIQKPFVVIIQDLKKEYSFGDIPRIGVFGREHYPLKTFAKAPQQVAYTTPKYLPSSSYYSIKDNETEEIIIDFDNYTKLSCDTTGNYFFLDTTGLAQERYYKVLIKVVDTSGTYTFDANNLFKVRR